MIATGTAALGEALAADASAALGVIGSLVQGIGRKNAIGYYAWLQQLGGIPLDIDTLAATPALLVEAMVGLVRAIVLVPGPAAGATRDGLTGKLSSSDPTAAPALAIETLLDNPAAASDAGTLSLEELDELRLVLSSLATLDPGYSCVFGAPVPTSVYTAPLAGTPSLQAILDNRAELLSLIRCAALIAAARVAAYEPFVDTQEAMAARNDLAGRLQLEIDTTPDDGVFAALRALRVAVWRSLTTEAIQLPELVAFVPPATWPALRVAYRLYDAPWRGSEICARNQILNPAFCPGGQPLAVLTA